jgi:hypothetical protein
MQCATQLLIYIGTCLPVVQGMPKLDVWLVGGPSGAHACQPCVHQS